MTYPTDLYRCLACGQEGLAQTQDRIYCPRCGQLYPLLASQAVDFVGPLASGDLAPLTPAQAIAHLPGFGWGYDQLWRPWALSWLTGEAFDQEREAHLLQEWIQEASPILDLGTTGGYWSRLILAQDPDRQLLGMDLAPGVLEEATRRRHPRWTHYSLLRASAERIPITSGSLGAVIAGATLNEISLYPSIQEIARILRPGGVLVTLHIQKDTGWGQMLQQLLKGAGLQFPSRLELETCCTAVGLEMDRYLSFGPIAWVRALRPPAQTAVGDSAGSRVQDDR